MLVPLSWLTKYVPVSASPGEIAHRLTMAGSEVTEVRETGANWDRDKVLVGRVLKVDPHPNADRLTLPTLDLGDGVTATVVCGAPNVAAGQKIAFAREGALLISARSGKLEALKAAKIRGVVSAGMVCSERELGLGEDHDGILVLDEDAPVGLPLADHLGDAIFDIDVTPNRPDCLSVLGIAREVAALTGETVTDPELDYPEDGTPIAEEVNIEIRDPELCPRYTASLVGGVTVGPSPGWLRDALSRVGQRSINNIVDITNFVMLEFGQPLHAFDFDKIRDRTVVIRAAWSGEEMLTLDDEVVKLRAPMLAIADSEKPIALAGVIGGVGTGVSEGTTAVLLESAGFDPINTRRTATALRLRTEASYRFERGIRPELATRALRRATRLIIEVAGGQAAKGIHDLYPGMKQPASISVTSSRINQILGTDYNVEQVGQVLHSLGFEATAPELAEGDGPAADDVMRIQPPYWRSDIAIEEDVVEEIARITGYDSIPTTTMSTSIPHHEPQPLREFRERVRDGLAAAGLQETISYSLTGAETLSVAATTDGGPPLEVANPMSSEGAVPQNKSARKRARNAGEQLTNISRRRDQALRDRTRLPPERRRTR